MAVAECWSAAICHDRRGRVTPRTIWTADEEYEKTSGERQGVSPMALSFFYQPVRISVRFTLSFFYQPVRISVRFTQNYVENRVLTHCG